MVAKFSRLIRFEDSSGKIHYGEAGADWKKDLHGETVPTYDISSPWTAEYPLTGDKVQVAKVRAYRPVALSQHATCTDSDRSFAHWKQHPSCTL